MRSCTVNFELGGISAKIAMSKRYNTYLQDPSTPIPKTSAWRRKKQHVNEAASVSSVKYGVGIKRRRLYNIDASVSIPRQTKWRWKKSNYIHNHLI